MLAFFPKSSSVKPFDRCTVRRKKNSGPKSLENKVFGFFLLWNLQHTLAY